MFLLQCAIDCMKCGDCSDDDLGVMRLFDGRNLRPRLRFIAEDFSLSFSFFSLGVVTYLGFWMIESVMDMGWFALPVSDTSVGELGCGDGKLR